LALLVANLIAGRLRVEDRQPCQAALGFERHPLTTLHTFERAGDGIRLASHRFQLGALVEVTLGFIGAAESIVGQAAEVIGPRIARAARNGRAKQPVRRPIIAVEVGVNAPAIQLFEHAVLAKCGRIECQRCQRDDHGRGQQTAQVPNHERSSSRGKIQAVHRSSAVFVPQATEWQTRMFVPP
jgi:hypothetical protein